MRGALFVGFVLSPAALWAQTICIDPGHPSEVGIGTQGRRTTEVKVAWEVAQELRRVLRADGYRVVLTKSSLMQKVKNRERANVANRARADLMVRLHCDASAHRGFAVYYPSRSGTVQGITGPSKWVRDSSKTAAGAFFGAMSKALEGSLPNQGLKTDLATAVGAKQGALTGSIFSQVPVLLVEMVVLTNHQDENFIVSKAGRAQMVRALSEGVRAAVRIAR